MARYTTVQKNIKNWFEYQVNPISQTMLTKSKHQIVNLLQISVVLFLVYLLLAELISLLRPCTILNQVNVGKINESKLMTPVDSKLPPTGYLVWNKHCRIPDVDPFTPDAMDIFKMKKYKVCSKKLPLIKVVFDMNRRLYSLHIDHQAKRKLTISNVLCAYQVIQRSGKGYYIDKEFKLNESFYFKDGDFLPSNVENFIVTCKSAKTKRLLQQDAFSLVGEKPEIQDRLKSYRNGTFSKRPASVLMLGIDSLSQFNIRRVMPETTRRLLKDNWFELRGYNKVDDNTFPNLMAILTGYNIDTVNLKCNPKTENGLSDCNMIWKNFRDNGYVTSLAEDETWMSTFTFNKFGFNKNPVDYYHHTFMLAVEKTLKTKKLSGMSFCVGLRHSAEYIYDYAMEVARRYKGEPYFGLFWTNTFSHNSFNDPLAMDTRIVKYLDEMSSSGILEESIVILFSDHGVRFGSLRNLRQGFLEERLPFIFIWLPQWFRERYPEFVKALNLNKHRLTNAYDLHMTMKHIIELTGRTSKLPQAEGCVNCQSLFYPVPEQRSCKDIAIDEHWCTCIPFEDVNEKSKVVENAINAVIKHLNAFLKNGNFFPRCAQLKPTSVESAQKRYDFDESLNSNATEKLEHYRVRFTANTGKFEASVTFSQKLKVYEIIDSVSRLDSYKDGSACIDDSEAKKYCICDIKANDKKTQTKSKT